VVGETVNKKSSNVDLVNYNFVRCNLEAFRKKVVTKPLSSRVKTSKWFQVDIAYVFAIKPSLLKDADKSKTISLHSFSGDVYKVRHTRRVVF
jgi:hypothetical protein